MRPHRIRAFVIAPVAAAVLAGCSFMPTYERPAAPVPAAFPYAAATEGTPAPALDWQRFAVAVEQAEVLGRPETVDRTAELIERHRTVKLFAGAFLNAFEFRGAGAVQGYFGGWTDLVLQRVIEIWSGMPTLYLLIILSSVVVPSFGWLLGLMLLFSWMTLVGVVRAEVLRARNFDYVRAARALGMGSLRVLWKHVRHSFANALRAWGRAWTGGMIAPAPAAGAARRLYRPLGRYAAAFAFAADMALLTLGGGLKRREMVSARFGDILSELYLLSAALRRWEDEGRQQADLPLLQWCMEAGFATIEARFDEIFANFPNRPVAWLLRFMLLPLGPRRRGRDHPRTARDGRCPIRNTSRCGPARATSARR